MKSHIILPGYALTIVHNAREQHQRLLSAVTHAKDRIYLTYLYLEQDEAGQELMEALYLAKTLRPSLDIRIFVDFHRAQRGRIGDKLAQTNAKFYYDIAQRYEHPIPVYGVPVHLKEIFGVLHFKGSVIDDTVIYTGASINNVYTQHFDRYRLDRYQWLKSPVLAQQFIDFFVQHFISSDVIVNFTQTLHTKQRLTRIQKRQFKNFRKHLNRTEFASSAVATPVVESEATIRVTPLCGLGKHNQLNQKIIQALHNATRHIWIFTPYFNFPPQVTREIKLAIKRGVNVDIIVGDKTANDFYIPPEEPFKIISGLPYLYEINLRQFAQSHESALATRQLKIHLWKDGTNSYHLKGLHIDDQVHIFTGHNLNPRAWSLDFESALLVEDKSGHLTSALQQERTNILDKTQFILSYTQFETLADYPLPVQRTIRRFQNFRLDKIIKRLL